MNQTRLVAYDTAHLFAKIRDRIRCIVMMCEISIVSLDQSICLYSQYMTKKTFIIRKHATQYRISETEISGGFEAPVKVYSIRNWTEYDNISTRVDMMYISDLLTELERGFTIRDGSHN